MLKIEYFYYMIEIAKVGAINKAADNLFISQPYLSLNLKELERELDVPLFIRSNKGVRLTEAGEKFLEYSKDIVEIIKKSKQLHNDYNAFNNSLSISSIYSFFMLDIFQEFSTMDEYSKDNISYEEIPNEYIPEKVSSGLSDIGIVYTSSNNLDNYLNRMTSLGIDFKPLVEEPVFVVINSKNPLASREYIEIDDLKKYRFIVEKIKVPNKNQAVENNIIPGIFKTSAGKSINFDNNRSLFYYLTKSDDCFSIGQKSLNTTNPFVVNGSLKYIPIKDLAIRMITGYVTKKNINKNRIQIDFEKHIHRHFGQISDNNMLI